MGTLPCGVEHFGVACDVGNGECVSHIEGETQRPVENGVFLRIAVASIKELAIRMEISDGDLAVAGGHRSHGTDKTTTGTLLGCGLCDKQIGAAAVLPEEYRQHMGGVADLFDKLGDFAELLLALQIGFLHCCDLRFGKLIVFLVLRLHLLVELVEAALRVGNGPQVELSLGSGQIGIAELLYLADQRWKRLLGKVVDDFRHALHGCDVTADIRHLRCEIPQCPMGDGFRLRGLLSGLFDGSLRCIGILEFGSVTDSGQRGNGLGFVRLDFLRLLVEPHAEHRRDADEDHQHGQHDKRHIATHLTGLRRGMRVLMTSHIALLLL